jgi:hypothetical protein
MADALNIEPAVTTATAANAIAVLRTMMSSFDTPAPDKICSAPETVLVHPHCTEEAAPKRRHRRICIEEAAPRKRPVGCPRGDRNTVFIANSTMEPQ